MKNTTGGFFRNLLILILLLSAAFIYVAYRYNENPNQVWRRIIASVERFTQPEPTPTPQPKPLPAPTPQPTPVATPTPQPTPTDTSTPVPTATPVDPVAWLVSDRKHWPTEVTLLEDTDFPAVQENKEVGFVKVPASSKVSVIEITPDTIKVSVLGAQKQLPHKATNLAELAKAAMQKSEGESAMPTPSADLTPALQKPINPTMSPASSAGKAKELTAWTAVSQMTPGINIGNTFDNVTTWETGWGSPLITKEFIQSLAQAGFKSVRLPVSWDTYSDKGRITTKEFQRIDEVMGWILDAGMFCVLNIHWDRGWIDSDAKERYPDTYHTFSAEAEKKFHSYWEQLSEHYADKNGKLIFEAFNEESTFDGEGSMEKAYKTLTRVNQLFVDTVRQSGGNNAHRLLVIPGYKTDFILTSDKGYQMPKDSVPGKLFVSVHYYTPWTFVGMSEDASWAKMQPTWGTEKEVKQLNEFFDSMKEFSTRTDTPVYVGEFCMCSTKDKVSSNLWTTSVYEAAVKRNMVPVLWDIGGAVSRKKPYMVSEETANMVKRVKALQKTSPSAQK